MKIAYIIEVNPYQNSGIVKKINYQIDYWIKQGHEVKPLILWPQHNNVETNYFNEGKLYSNKILNRLPDNFIKTYLTKIFTLPEISKTINLFAPDVLYIRQNIWYPGLTKVLKRYKSILEINSVDHLEMNFNSYFKKQIYLFGKERILKSVKGLIAVSPEILKHYNNYKLITKVVSNGINIHDHKVLKTNTDSKSINMVFVGSNNMKWHGLNKIINLAKMFPNWKIYIVGYTEKDFGKEKLNNVEFLGWLNKKELELVYEKCQFGIASFGNHLVGKPMDSTLKVREYLAYGFPVLSGHHDVDFLNSKIVYKITDETNNFLPKATIEQHVDKYVSLIVKKEDILIIDSVNKERERLDFFNLIRTIQ